MNQEEFKDRLRLSYEEANEEEALSSKERVWEELALDHEGRKWLPIALLLLCLIALGTLLVAYSYWKKTEVLINELAVAEHTLAELRAQEHTQESEKLTLTIKNTIEIITTVHDTIEKFTEIEKVKVDTLVVKEFTEPKVLEVYRVDTVYVSVREPIAKRVSDKPGVVQFNFNDEESILKRNKKRN